MRSRVWISLALLLLAGMACHQPSEVPDAVRALEKGARWEGARSEVALGEPIELQLWVRVDLEQLDIQPSFVLPELEGGKLEPRGLPEFVPDSSRMYWTRPYRLTWLRLGEQTLPAFEMHFPGRKEKLSTQSLDFEVSGLLTADDAKDAEIPTELFQDAPTSMRILYMILGAVVLALAVGWWLQHRLKGDMHEVDSGPVLSPFAEARQSLARIEAEWRAQRLDGESLVVEVSGVLRTYLQKGVGFHSLTHTTEEFLDELRCSTLVPKSVQAPMAGFLQQCDLIKFAAQGTDSGLCSALLDKTRALVDDVDAGPIRESPRKAEVVHGG